MSHGMLENCARRETKTDSDKKSEGLGTDFLLSGISPQGKISLCSLWNSTSTELFTRSRASLLSLKPYNGVRSFGLSTPPFDCAMPESPARQFLEVVPRFFDLFSKNCNTCFLAIPLQVLNFQPFRIHITGADFRAVFHL